MLDAAVAVAWHGNWTTQDAAMLEGAAADASMAILTSGIVHPTVTAALYAPFAEVVPIGVLQEDLERTLAMGAGAARRGSRGHGPPVRDAADQVRDAGCAW